MIQPYPYIQWKHPSLLDEWKHLRPMAQEIANEQARFCELHNQPFMITDIMSEAQEDLRLKRVSKSHSEGRAWDIRTSWWPLLFKTDFETRFEILYREEAARSKTTGLPNLIFYHDNGNGPHAHCQIKP